jgi:hypothetical protein
MSDYMTGYDNGWADCLKDRREKERTVLEEACMVRHLSANGGHRDLLARIIEWEVAVATDEWRIRACSMTIAQKR